MASFSRADPGWLGAGFVASLAASLLSALRWHALACWLGMPVPRARMILAYWRGVMANTVLPGATLGGDALRSLHLKEQGHSLSRAAASVVLDRLSGLWMLVSISLAMTVAALSSGLLPETTLSLSLVAAVVLTLVALAAPAVVLWLSGRMLNLFPLALGSKVRPMAAALGVLSVRAMLLHMYGKQMLWSGSVQLFSILAFACGGYAIGLDLPWWQFVIAAGPIFAFAALPVGVGGWGTREAAAAVVLGAFAVPHEAAVACAILYGLFATLQGLLGALSLFLSKGKSHG